MAERYQQFLGSNPGTIVELIDDSGSPYRVSTESGFEFTISADDFHNYYRKVGDRSPARWKPMVTESAESLVNSVDMAEIIRIVRLFEEPLQHFDKARSFTKDLLKALQADEKQDLSEIKRRLKDLEYEADFLTQDHINELAALDDKKRELLLGDSCGVVPLLDPSLGPNGDGDSFEVGADPDTKAKGEKTKKKAKKKPAKPKPLNMKNVELDLAGDNLTLKVDLTQDFGPSKSGKTIIVASSSGNKKIPGREERIGINVYKSESQKPAKGRKQEFKNMVMSVDGDTLTISVDLSKDLGLSKSGQTMLVASSGGNQLVFGREEKIGLNIYRPID